ncbi:MAG: NTP transferase domain-containing protein [Micavibrio aeruginosavorus]|uniref:NTP transferase domain-containing protein n=1 Tax=Micavibrio aeruginosavorus TaxID=349221 RepID=A0A7T5R3T7_9BACT|nr:MAG: NTP transferase domain-containing protein [Micavibrio aeruginosavorus]
MSPEVSLHGSIVPVILAGGAGRRLQPWSRALFPKPFLRVRGRSLLQHTLERVRESSPLIVCAYGCREHAREQAAALNVDYHLLLEPCARNTAPAVAAAAAHILHHKGNQAWMLAMPSDHAIDDISSLKNMANEAVDGRVPGIVSFGVRPSRASPRFGYILEGRDGVAFHEKPDRRAARALIDAGACWNSGVWLARVDNVRMIFRDLAPMLWQKAEQAVVYARHEGRETILEPAYFSCMEPAAIDCVVMEKYPGLTCRVLQSRWRDLGCWPSMIAYLCGF